MDPHPMTPRETVDANVERRAAASSPTTHSTVTAVTLCLCVTFLLALLILRLT